MKIRNGFISNSSTSSFILIGVELYKKSDKTKIKQLFGNDFDEENWDELIFDARGDEYGFDVYDDYENNSIFVGKIVVSESGYLGVNQPVEKFIEKINETNKDKTIQKLKDLGFDPKLIISTIDNG